MRPPVLEAGKVVFGKYRLIEKIGEGGMGEVWRVWHVNLEAERALKLIKSEIRLQRQGLETVPARGPVDGQDQPSQRRCRL